MPVKHRRTAGLGLGARDLVAADLATFLLLLFLLVFLTTTTTFLTTTIRIRHLNHLPDPLTSTTLITRPLCLHVKRPHPHPRHRRQRVCPRHDHLPRVDHDPPPPKQRTIQSQRLILPALPAHITPVHLP